MTTAPIPVSKSSRVPASIYLQLLAMVLIWGLVWPIIKPALRDLPPVNFVAVRFGGAAILMAALTVAMRQRLLPAAEERRPLALLGAIQMAGSQLLSTVALYYVPAGRTVVLLYSVQLWALPLSWLLNGERISWRAIAGGVIGFGGLLLYVNPLLIDWHDGYMLFGSAMAIAAGFAWALGACLYRRRVWRTSFWTQTWWQVLWSAAVTVPVGLLFGSANRITWNGTVFFALGWSWIGATVLCWLFWGKALAAMPAWRAGQIACLTPIVTVVISAMVAGERITTGALVSFVLIGTGIFLAVRRSATASQQTR